jgi:hypothetical protein
MRYNVQKKSLLLLLFTVICEKSCIWNWYIVHESYFFVGISFIYIYIFSYNQFPQIGINAYNLVHPKLMEIYYQNLF